MQWEQQDPKGTIYKFFVWLSKGTKSNLIKGKKGGGQGRKVRYKI